MSEDASTQAGPSKTTGKRRSAWLMLLILLVLGGGVYGWYHLDIWPTGQIGATGALEEQAARIDGLESARQDLQREHRARLDALAEQQSRLAARLEEIEKGGRQSWVLGEAEALASLARQRLLLTGDVSAAERLIVAADELVAELDDPGLMPIREALARDREALASAPKVDVEGLALRLSALQQQIPGLVMPRRERSLASPEDQHDQDLPQGLARWLKGLPLTVRRYDQRVPLPLDQQEQQLVRLSLEMSLQEARLALLQGRSENYRIALSQARIVLSEWFASGPVVDGFDDALAALEQQPIARARPDIGAGHAAIRARRQAEAEQ